MANATKSDKLSREEVNNSKNNLLLTGIIAKENKNMLSDTIIIHINHALCDVFAFNEFIINELKAKLFFISIPYNTTYYPQAKYDYLYIKRSGNNYSYFFNKRRVNIKQEPESVIDSIHIALKYTISYIKKEFPQKKIIVLQDGGYISAKGSIFKKDPFVSLNNFLGLVEQTQSGTKLIIEKTHTEALNYPVITISRSLIKMRVESFFIAQRILEEINRTLYKMGYFLNFKSIIVGGYGIIGRQLANYFNKLNTNVIILENNPRIKKLAEKEGYKTISSIGTRDFDKTFLFVGVTGQSTFGVKSFLNFLESKNKYYFVASGSSKRHEFGELIDFIETTNKSSRRKYYLQHPILKEVSNIKILKNQSGVLEYQFKYNSVHKKLFMLAEGFPINLYDHEIHSVPDRAIDPIIALLLLSVIKLQKCYKKLPKILNHVSDEYTKKILGIDEELLLSKWCYINDISFERMKPFDLFTPHPLEKLLIGIP